MTKLSIFNREKFKIDTSQDRNWLEVARTSFQNGNFNKAFDIYEQLCIIYPERSTEILAEAYDKYQIISDQDRYVIYQSRYYNFNINPNDKVLDIGSGNRPLKLATHFMDIAINNHVYGRAGVPFKYVKGKPLFECNIEDLPFEDKEFDFVYCSHVLEHVINPKKACDELMRVAKRGYVETPKPHKDMLMNQAQISNHIWAVENINNKLVFTEYSQEQVQGLGSNILLDMHCSPQTLRERAFSALIYLKARLFNTMLIWEDSFKYEIQRLNRPQKTQNSVITHKSIKIPEQTKQDMKYVHKNNILKNNQEIQNVKSKHFSNITMPVKINNRSKIKIIGTEYGSSAVILDLIPVGSTVISAGVGEDISFDLELIKLKNCKIIGIDPTEKAKRFVENNKHDRFCFLQKALYSESNKKIKIYKNTNPDYVSESITQSHNMVSTSESYEAETISIPDLLKNYEDVSVLKLDIEGAEYTVINSLKELYIPQIYVEFHHFCTDFTTDDTTRCIMHLNDMGYVVVYGKSLEGVLKDVTLVHRKYVSEEDIIQIRTDRLGEADFANSAALATHIL
jgi:FkbM family methyltransferase